LHAKEKPVEERWKGAVLAGTVIALVSACGGGGGEQPPGPTSGSAAGTLDLSGVAVLHSDPDTISNQLIFHDPATGAPKTTLELPPTENSMTGSGGPTTKLDLFSPDWQYAAWPVDGAIQLYKLNADAKRYEPAGSVLPPPPSMTAAEPAFTHPRFSPDSSALYFDDTATSDEGPASVYSVDYRRPQQPVKKADLAPEAGLAEWKVSPKGEVVTEKDFKHVQVAAGDYTGEFTYAVDASGEIFYASSASMRGAVEDYDFVTVLDATTVLLHTTFMGYDELGSLVEAKIDPVAGRVDFTKIQGDAEEANLQVEEAVAAPDKSAVLIRMDGGKWFQSSTAPGTTSTPAFAQMPQEDRNEFREVLAWE
jgi:hypothetical protein